MTTPSGKEQKTADQNQAKTNFFAVVAVLQLVFAPTAKAILGFICAIPKTFLPLSPINKTKSLTKRNSEWPQGRKAPKKQIDFEAGILTDNPELVEQAMNQFDAVWIGKHCARCKRKAFCGDPIA